MDALHQALAWIAAHPSEAAWILVGVLTASVALYHRLRPTIKAYVDTTTATWDNHLVESLDRFFSGVDWVIGLVELVLPRIASAGRSSRPGAPPPSPPPPTGGTSS